MASDHRQPLLSELSRRRKLALFAEHLASRAKILEIGPGDGWFTRKLRALGHAVVTIDLVADADFRGDINRWRELGLPEAGFDAVIALEVIEHVDCLESSVSLLAPGGVLMLSSPHPDWDWVMKLLEAARLTQKRTSPHDHLVDFTSLAKKDPRIQPLKLTRPAGIHQVGVFRKVQQRAAAIR